MRPYLYLDSFVYASSRQTVFHLYVEGIYEFYSWDIDIYIYRERDVYIKRDI